MLAIAACIGSESDHQPLPVSKQWSIKGGVACIVSVECICIVESCANHEPAKLVTQPSKCGDVIASFEGVFQSTWQDCSQHGSHYIRYSASVIESDLPIKRIDCQEL